MARIRALLYADRKWLVELFDDICSFWQCLKLRTASAVRIQKCKIYIIFKY